MRLVSVLKCPRDPDASCSAHLVECALSTIVTPSSALSVSLLCSDGVGGCLCALACSVPASARLSSLLHSRAPFLALFTFSDAQPLPCDRGGQGGRE
eukprot:scaffold189300_cov30-Tisochrysis_lutea.AAC.1